jgi:HD domain
MREQAVVVADRLLMLINKYASELRSSTQPARLRSRQEFDSDYKYRPDDPLIRENLMEHVGMLPALAVEIYPYLNDPAVDLGQALTMLAIHDIGELLVGDVNTYVKKADLAKEEEAAALSLLHKRYHSLYKEMESRGTNNPAARFARSVDKLAPDIFELLLPVEYSVNRLDHFAKLTPGQIIPAILKRSREAMLWNPFMTELNEVVCGRLEARLLTPRPRPTQ